MLTTWGTFRHPSDHWVKPTQRRSYALAWRSPSDAIGGRFIESPGNLWTVKIQPRDGSLRLTIRGVPERLRPAARLGLKDDRPGYSTFKVRTGRDIPLAIAVLGRVLHR